jgi:hypothetical protein
MTPTNFKDMTGARCGRLTVIRREGSDGRLQAKWLCKCDCGDEKVVHGSALRSGNTLSCGCLHRERSAAAATIHGGTYLAEFTIWQCMKARCDDASDPRYGGRGIRVCDRWIASFEAFLADMGHRPSDGHSIDRYPNADGHYEPGNCRWATLTEQARNRHTNVYLELDGVRLLVQEWAERKGMAYQTLWARLKLGWSTERAITTPVRMRRSQ